MAAVTGSPVASRVVSEGVATAYLDWGGDGPPLILLHPNGFCAGLYDPLARRLVDRCRVVGVDLRGHGASDDLTAVDELGNDLAARDVLAVADHLEFDRFSVLGVSFGGAVGIEAAAAAPDRIAALLLCEAIAIDPDSARPHPFGDGDGDHPLAVGARRRRDVWDDREEVLASYGSRPPLDALDPEALAGYVRWGFRDRDDGRIDLACPPETEANIFGRTRIHGPIEAFAARRRVNCPVSFMAGSRTYLYTGFFVAQAAAVG
ncbi:alpha/beta hydrolase [bacterium]|nr:alpha/beta hydrolase [bacterium]